MARADSILAQVAATNVSGGATNYLVETPSGVLYVVYIDSVNDVAFKKSTDSGLTWTVATVVFTGTVNNLAIWYDRWSGITAGLIHIAYTETGGSDTLYRTIDTESSDALSTQTTIFAGLSAVLAGSNLSICRARGGNVYCKTQIDAGAEGCFNRLPNANVPNGAWDTAPYRTDNEALATLDQCILLPGWNADNQDMHLIFWDVSANEISVQRYDDSANTWAEASLTDAVAFVESNPATAWPHFAATVDLTNSRNIVVAWNGIDTANADLVGWFVDDTTDTAFTTSIVANGTDDQGLAGVTIDSNGDIIVTYSGKSDGSETFPSAMNAYCKVSSDDGATWGAETLLTSITQNLRSIYAPAIAYSQTGANVPFIYYAGNATAEMKANVYLAAGASGGGHIIGGTVIR